MTAAIHLSRLFTIAVLLFAISPTQPAFSDHTPTPASVTIAGDLQSELGCPGDWQPECANTHLSAEEVWRGIFTLPAGDYQYKAALNNGWDENYGAGGVQDGPNIPLSTSGGEIRFYYDHETHWVTDNVNSVIATAAGSFQSELGCPGDWQPWCLRSWLQDADGDGVYVFTTAAIPAGGYEMKVALDEDWAASYPGSNLSFTVTDGATVTITFDAATADVTVDVDPGSDPGDEALAQPPVRSPILDEVMYFVLPDRFDNGEAGNDAGGDTSGDPLVNGLLPDNSGYYHGGDLAGLTGKLDYLEGLGVTALWVSPPFTNRWVQGDGTIPGSSASYHGYWQMDFSAIDPHFGSNAEMEAFIDEAHSRGMQVFFDIVVNHTADLIAFEEGVYNYRNKTDFPYRAADGSEFDDSDFAGTGTFPPLDAAISFPYTPTFDEPWKPTAKSPAWLNDPIYYHNRGNSTFTGENSLYGDFFGLDDLFTEHPDVVDGMIDLHRDIIDRFDIDGFRLDTVKHVNDAFWETFVPAIRGHAAAAGKPDFFVFGEVFDGDPGFLSRYTTELPLPSVLDFPFRNAMERFAVQGAGTDELAAFFASDDYYTDADSNAHQLMKFTSNHDIGRLGFAIDRDNPGAGDAERLARMRLGHALMYFSRGTPVIYYGDEQGFVGDGGDRDARQDMLPSQVPSYNDDDLIGTAATTADANFDATHPLYTTLADYAGIRASHQALRSGAQVQRYSQSGPGLFAFSRIDRDEQVEYLVVLNNAETGAGATLQTDSPDTAFTEIYPSTGAGLAADALGQVDVSLPALGFAVYRADTALPDPTGPPLVSLTAPAADSEVLGRVEVAAQVDADSPAEVTFAVSSDGGVSFSPIGTDDSAPYRVFYDVSAFAPGTALAFKAVANNLHGDVRSDSVSVTVGSEGGTPTAAAYAVIHYLRDDGDYGDPTTGDYNDYWGLHLWGDIEATVEWTSPKPFTGEDEYGRFAWVKLAEGATDVGFIVHRGDSKDGTDADRFFNPSVTPEIWLRSDDANTYTSQADAQQMATVRYRREDGDYGNPASDDYNDFWGLHIWGDAADPSELTDWTQPKKPDGFDDYGAFWHIQLQDPSQPLNFIIHRGDNKDPGPDQTFTPRAMATGWIQSGDETIYGSRGAATNTAVLHYHRPAGDYGDYSSDDFNDFWGMHVWTGAENPNPAWQQPVKPLGFDGFGPVFEVSLTANATELAYILHRGDEKDPGPDQFLNFATSGYEVWQLQGTDPDDPYILPLPAQGAGNPGNIGEQRAYWVAEDLILWSSGDSAENYRLHFAPDGGLSATEDGITGGSSIELTEDPGPLPADVAAKFPHLASLPMLRIDAADLGLAPDILRGQIAVSALDGEGLSVDATGLQIPGVLDDLYTYEGALGVDWTTGSPSLHLWAPTARSVTLHLFDDSDPATPATLQPMDFDPATGVWSAGGDGSWDSKYYLFEIEVYVHATGQVENNLVTDPYSLSLAMNSTRSQVVDLDDPALAPAGWDMLEKPPLPAPEDISIYELHVRDFSANDPLVDETLKGTFGAFSQAGSHGIVHLEGLAEAGLTHLHLLPSFDIATVDEDRSTWQSPDPAELETYAPDSDQQQALVTATEDLDGFNWGYDPFHYTVPEGSYATDPDGGTRILEFREMVRSVNGMGLRLVMDVVYNHTNAAGQADKSVLDRIVPGYYHRLNDAGAVETSTCCANTATEHNMMEKLMVDSLVTWARDYKVDAFRFDLMGHHMKRNMQAVRDALDELTPEADGVDGSAIYLYGEGWNFGEVADNARGVNATQANMAGTGIGTFNDRLRDAVRGGGPFDGGEDLIRRQGFANGLFYDPNALNSGSQGELDTLLLVSDQIRVGMAGNLADYSFIDRNGNQVTGAQVDYNGSPAGYTQDPQEDITYVSKHDNQTLYDNNVYKAPVTLSTEDRARQQAVALSTVLLGQGVPFLHAGVDLLRSKSLDRDSFNSGDWFNRLDFTYESNNFGVGLPVAGKNQDNWPIMQPLLADPTLVPLRPDIVFSSDLTRELLQIRYSSPLFRLQTEQAVMDRLSYHNTGPSQVPGLIVMSLIDDDGSLDRPVQRIVTLVNANDEPAAFGLSGSEGSAFRLHPVQVESVDPLVRTASFDSAAGIFDVPGRTTAVFLQDRSVEDQADLLAEDVQQLVDNGDLQQWEARVLLQMLTRLDKDLAAGNTRPAERHVEIFIRRVEQLRRRGRLSDEHAAELTEAAQAMLESLRRMS